MERTGLPEGPNFYSDFKGLTNNAELGGDQNRDSSTEMHREVRIGIEECICWSILLC